jgi:hypothetical protein
MFHQIWPGNMPLKGDSKLGSKGGMNDHEPEEKQ